MVLAPGRSARRRDPVRAGPQADAVHDWPLTTRRFLLGLGRFLLEMLHPIWQALVVLSLLLGWTVLSVAQTIPCVRLDGRSAGRSCPCPDRWRAT
jgi:hypothetical protein